MKKSNVILSVFAAAVLLFTSCKKEYSSATGWQYNNVENGGYLRAAYQGQELGPGLVFVQGGRFSMGRAEDDVNYSWDGLQTPVTVSSFYMDETEVTNQHWLDYMHWLQLVFGDAGMPQLIERALPDTNCWRRADQDMEKYVELYLRHPAYRDYPVVGVSWLQANDYCSWRTDRVNEWILIREGFLPFDALSQNESSYFTTDTYLNGLYVPSPQGDAKPETGLEIVNPKALANSGKDFRRISTEDGILLPRYRLPTEAEWEYSAMALIGNSYRELIQDRRTYPWNGHFVRNDADGSAYFGTLRANFMRGSGDAMGVAGYLNDAGDITTPVYQYPPNDFGLYNMAGNVSEWVADVYRPLTESERAEFRPYRGNVYKTRDLTEGQEAYTVYDTTSMKKYVAQLANSTVSAQKGGKLQFTAAEEGLIADITKSLDDACARFAQDKNEENLSTDISDNVILKLYDIMNDSSDPKRKVARTMYEELRQYVRADIGRQKMRDVSLEENINRLNYRKADNIDYGDGDYNSSKWSTKAFQDPSYENREDRMYDYGKTTLINNRSRVYKGGSWEDRAYYLVPSTRRFLDERRSSRDIGFRCAMDAVGSPEGIGSRGVDE